MCYFQAYCCAYQKCAYVGRFCPAIAGIIPASYLAKLIYGRKKVVKSKVFFVLHAVLASLSEVGLIMMPLYWIGKLGHAVALGYVACHLIYYLIFGLSICPACAIRKTCPGGKLQSMILKK
jgi:hypothetical protein